MSAIRLVLHDWNGCLINDVPHRFEHGVCAIFRHFGLPLPTLDDYSQNISSDFMVYYYSRGVPNTGDKTRDGETLNAVMRAGLAGVPIPPLFPDTRMFLEALQKRGITQSLVSGMMEDEFHRQVGHHQLEPFFHDMRGGVYGKAPVFKELLDRYGVDPSEAVGVTDMMSDAVELAEVGVTPIIIPRGYIVPDKVKVPTLIVAEDFLPALMVIDFYR